jgi:hypothetical protein
MIPLEKEIKCIEHIYKALDKELPKLIHSPVDKLPIQLFKLNVSSEMAYLIDMDHSIKKEILDNWKFWLVCEMYSPIGFQLNPLHYSSLNIPIELILESNQFIYSNITKTIDYKQYLMYLDSLANHLKAKAFKDHHSNTATVSFYSSQKLNSQNDEIEHTLLTNMFNYIILDIKTTFSEWCQETSLYRYGSFLQRLNWFLYFPHNGVEKFKLKKVFKTAILPVNRSLTDICACLNGLSLITDLFDVKYVIETCEETDDSSEHFCDNMLTGETSIKFVDNAYLKNREGTISEPFQAEDIYKLTNKVNYGWPLRIGKIQEVLSDSKISELTAAMESESQAEIQTTNNIIDTTNVNNDIEAGKTTSKDSRNNDLLNSINK